MHWSDWYWPFWLIVGFGVPEAIALVSKRQGDTLSERLRNWGGTEENPKGKLVRLRRLGLLAALAWLSVHVLTTGWV
jgi:hypothetical protein